LTPWLLGQANTPLFIATFRGHLGIVKYLALMARQDVNITNNLGINPLDIALWRKHMDAAQHLLDKGAKLSGTKKLDYYGITVNPNHTFKPQDLNLYEDILKKGTDVEKKLARVICDLRQDCVSPELIMQAIKLVEDLSKGKEGTGSAEEKEALARTSNDPDCICQLHCFFSLMYTPQNLLAANMRLKHNYEKLCQKCRLFVLMTRWVLRSC